MTLLSPRHSAYASLVVALLFSAPVFANRLVVSADASWWFHFGAAVVLYAHIGGGTLGILSGLVASFSRKGSRVHRNAGKIFLWSMSICYVIAAIVAPFLNSQQSTNFVAAILALYLLVTGVSAARRRQFVAGVQEKVGVWVAIAITLVGAVFMWLSAQSPDGSVDGSPPQAYILFIVAGSLAVLGDIGAIWRKKLSNNARVVRHLWRMCMSLFIASGSAFFGQAQFFPAWFNESPLPLMLGFFPLLVLLAYVSKYSFVAISQRRQAALNSVSH